MNLREAFGAGEPLPTLHYRIDLGDELMGVLLKRVLGPIREATRNIWFWVQTDNL